MNMINTNLVHTSSKYSNQKNRVLSVAETEEFGRKIDAIRSETMETTFTRCGTLYVIPKLYHVAC